MGQKYLVRTNEERVFPLDTVSYTDYTTNSLFEFLKLLITKRGKILYAIKCF